MLLLLAVVALWVSPALADNGDGDNGRDSGDTGYTDPSDTGEVVPPDSGESGSGSDSGQDSGSDDDLTDADLDWFTLADGDCDDANADVYPGRDESCDTVDNDCDGRVDEGCPLNADLGGGCNCATRDGALLLLAPLGLIRRRASFAVRPLRTKTS